MPIQVILMAATAIGLGTFFGGWRIVKTMAFKITDLKPNQGFCAETGGGVILASMAWLGIPVSTTHAISGAIMGVGATTRLSAVRWGIGKRLVYAWIITIPASALVAGLILFIIRSIF
ncbi:MAG: inorganic phosphate transporter [Thaumarchaeota archaeon]|nr:MAG: inorganic phosphate transporter [Nitrososphaerota archaeon]